MTYARATLILAIVLLGAGLRLMPQPDNFNPITALALFAAAHFSRTWQALLIAFSALVISDVALGNSWIAVKLFVYGTVFVTVLIGTRIRERQTVPQVVVTTVVCALLFFVVTNFGFWLTSGIYAFSWQGLASCYFAAIPFFRMTLAGDLFYSGLFFGGFALLSRLLFPEQTTLPVSSVE